MTLTKDHVAAILPGVSHLDAYFPYLLAGMDRYQITQSPQRMAGYLSQMGEETDSLRSLVEYDSGAAYENRTDLGNTHPGDGVKYKGRGSLMATGLAMYAWASKSMYDDARLILHPELLELPENAFLVGAWIWTVAKALNPVCDLPETWVHPGPHQYTKVQWMTEKINGGQNGYLVRLANYQRARKIFGF